MAERSPADADGPNIAERADSGTEIVADEITEGQVLQQRAEERARPAGSASARSRIGQLLADRYRLERLIAKGGMGRVYLATQLPLERKVAVKLLISKGYDEEFRQRFFLEASTCARLVHRHIVTVHDYGEAENGELFMAMEYLDGEPLSKVIAKEIRLASDRVCQIGLQVCRALRTAHKSGIVHRDLKPGNIMLLRDEDHESGDFIKVLDFGLVKAFQTKEGPPVADLTRSGTWLGSPRYMAPEQIRCKDIDPRTDVYSLGVIMFHMVAGRPPFVGGNSVEILEQHLRDPVPSIRDTVGQITYAPELEVIIQKCMQKNPADRYQSMDDLVPELKAAYRMATGVSIHTESSLPTYPDLAEVAAEGSGSGRGSPPPRQTPRTGTVSTRPPPVPELGPPPDLSEAGAPASGDTAYAPPPLLEASAEGPVSGLHPMALDHEASIATTRPRSGRKWILLALVLLLVLFAGYTVTRLVSGGAKVDRPAVAAGVELTIESTPSGVDVVGPRGQVLGTTPYTASLPSSARGAQRRYTLRRAGFESTPVVADLDRDRVLLQATLQPVGLGAPEVDKPPPQPKVEAESLARPKLPQSPRPRARSPSRSSRRPRRETPRAVTAPNAGRPATSQAPSKVKEGTPSIVPPTPADVDSVERTGRDLIVDEDDRTTVRDREVPVVD